MERENHGRKRGYTFNTPILNRKGKGCLAGWIDDKNVVWGGLRVGEYEGCVLSLQGG